MLPEVLAHLRCPICREPLQAANASLRCLQGHAFDLARQGYVNLLAGRDVGTGDSAEMVAARAEFLKAAHFAPLADALAELALHTSAPGLVVEIGAGTGYYVSHVLERLATRHGLALDLSKHAAKRAARAHPRLAAIVADAWRPLPLEDTSAALVLDVFAPRQAAELHRILQPEGALLVATPTAQHLVELRSALGLLAIDPRKEERVASAFEAHFRRTQRRPLEWTLRLDHADVERVVAMGPSARHIAPEALRERVSALPAVVDVTASIHLEAYARPADRAAGT